MATALLVQVDPDTTSLLRPGASASGAVRLEEVSEPELALRHLEHDGGSVEAVVLGARLEEPIRLAQRVHAADRDLAVLILSEPERYQQLTRALQFAPFIGEEVRCWSIADGDAVAAELAEAMSSTAQRRRHRAALAAAQVSVSAATSAPPRTVEYLGQLLNHAPIGVVTVDAHGGIVAWNPRASQIFGKGERAVLSTSLSQLFPETERESLGRLVGRAPASDATAPVEVFERRGARGERQFVEVTAASIAGRGGELASLLLIQDVTERTRLEESQRFLARATATLVSSLDFEATLRSLARLVVPALADWCFIRALADDGSPSRFEVAGSGPASEVLVRGPEDYPAGLPSPGSREVEALHTGRSVLMSTVPDSAGEQLARDAEHPETPPEIPRKIDVRSMMIVPLVARERTLGTITFVSGESGRRYDEQDLRLAEDLAGRAALAVDNARLYREAQAAIRLRDEFLSIASHELRNPVAGIKGAAQLLRRADERGQLDRERLHRYLDIIQHTTTRLGALTEDLLDVSRLQTGELPLRPRWADVAALVEAAISRMRTSGELERIALDLDCHPCSAVVDPDRLEQVVENLVGNAVKYSPGGGEIRVTLARDGDDILLSVQDSGIGLPHDALERIFEPFGRAPNAVARNIEGLGLGLYICRRITEQHGGRLWAESAGEGRGTTMLVRLPVSSPAFDARDGGDMGQG